MSTQSKFSKLVAGLVGFSTAFMMIGTASVAEAAALTQSQIDAIVSLLQSFGADSQTIANVQASLSGGTPTGGSTTGGTTTGTCAYTFATNLKQGMTSTDVMNLQKVLNKNAATQVAATGVGSAGNESTYFGAMTKAAVVKFQELYAADILTPVGLTAGNGYVGAGTRAKLNAVCAGGSTTGGSTTTGTGVTVSSATQPANSLAIENAANLPFTKFTLTNNGSSDATVNSVTVELQGLAQKSAFDSVVLLDNDGQRIGRARSLNSNDQATIGEAVVIKAGASKTFTVAANMDADLASEAGEVANFAVVAVNTSATVSGSLPIVGASHTTNATLAMGTAVIDEGSNQPNDNDDVEVGDEKEVLASVQVEAGSAEDVSVKSIRFYQTGSVSSSDLSGLKIEADGDDYTVSVSSDGKYYTATFGNGITIEEGRDLDFKLVGDIDSGSGRTIEFEIDENTDVVVVGKTYGYGITPTGTFTSSTLDITGGEFQSFSRDNETSSANVAVEKSGEVLGGFLIELTGEAINVDDMTIYVDLTNAGGAAADVADITNVKLVDEDGTVLAGPVDGDSTNSGAHEGSILFTNVTIPSGETRLIVTGELGDAFGTNETVILSTNPSTDWDDVRGEDTNDAATLPNVTVSAHTMTVKAASLTVRNLATPAAQNVVAGMKDFVFAKAALDAQDSGEDVEVTSITVDVAVADDATVGDLDNMEIWTLKSDGSLNVKVSDTKNITAASTAFDLRSDIVVAKGTTVNVAIVADISSGATRNGDAGDTWTVDVSDAEAEGATSNVDADPSSIGGTNGQAMTLAENATVAVTIDSTSPEATFVLDGSETTLAVFQFEETANVEDVNLEKITLDVNPGVDDAVDTYKVYKGSTLVGEASGGSADVAITLNNVVIAKNSKVDLTIKGVMADVDGTTVQNGDTVALYVTAYEATGKTSGTSLDSSANSSSAATHTLYEAYPTVAFDNTGVSTTLVNNANHLLAKIKVTNNGSEDVTFNNADTNTLTVQINSVSDDSDTAAAEALSLRDENGNILDSNQTFNNVTGAEVTFNLDGAYTAGLTVGPNSSKYFYLYADTSDHEDDGDSIQVWLDDTAGDLVFGIDSTGAYNAGAVAFKGDLYGPTHVNP
ncbi:MAG: peptidoglycan-binding protein [Candidatus Yonathbacteria bacterium]|nr:peptidoglycan-binding protein [Candidatus Yonathbacteria bacterium]